MTWVEVRVKFGGLSLSSFEVRVEVGLKLGLGLRLGLGLGLCLGLGLVCRLGLGPCVYNK